MTTTAGFALLGLDKSVSALKAGQLVIVPTETVYGLAADAGNSEGIKAIFIAKNRPASNPLIVHVGSVEELSQWAVVPKGDVIETLLKTFWPGPLTIVLKAKPHVNPVITAGQPTVALRMPAHPLTLQLLQQLGSAIVAPSANPSTRISPTSIAAVQQVFASEPSEQLQPIAGILAADAAEPCCQVGIESTIVDLTQLDLETGQGPWQILRLGMIAQAQLETILGLMTHGDHAQKPVVPGQQRKHYAPRVKTQLMTTAEITAQSVQHGEVLVFAYSDELQKLPHFLKMPREANDYAARLYQQLQHAETMMLADETLKTLWIEAPPNASEWQAVLDRLTRATALSV